jgi:drug/metabolite transporter (DMT)-like permease
VTSHTKKNVILPILLTCLGYGCYNLNDAGLKFVLQKLHWSQIMMTSASITIVFMIIYGLLRERDKFFRTKKPGLMFTRAALSQFNGLSNLFAFPHIHLTTFYTLVFTSPFWLALIMAVFFKEKLDPRRMGVILFGFFVILCIFRPGGALFDGWALLILASAFLYSWQLIIVRKIGSGESRALMYICGSVMSVLIGLSFLGDHYVPLTGHQWALLLGMGMVGVCGLLCIGYAFQEAPSASVVAPYHYTQIIWGALLGYYIFGEVPNIETMIGSALIILAGLYLIRHETRKTLIKPEEA